MKTLTVVINACTTLLLLLALIVIQKTYHILATGEGMPAGFHRLYFEEHGSMRLLIIALILSIITLILSILKKENKNIPPNPPV